MSKKGLDCADVSAALEKVGSEAMSECVCADAFIYSSLTDRCGNGLVDGTGIKMMSPQLVASGITGEVAGRKYILPSPVFWSIRILPGESMWHVDLSIACF